MRARLVVVFGVALPLCAATCPGGGAGEDPELTVETECSDPRPEMCTRDYNPVCGKDAYGAWKTFSNGCTACADETVVGYRAGKCVTLPGLPSS